MRQGGVERILSERERERQAVCGVALAGRFGYDRVAPASERLASRDEAPLSDGRSALKTTFDKYQLLDKIGRGGMAEVFLAKSFGAEGLEKTLVIKRILPELAQSARFVEMFIAEARIAVGLNHPNIVQIYDFGKIDQDFYLAMEHVDGWDLGRVMSASWRHKAMSVGDCVYIAIEIAKGLDYAHRRVDADGQRIGLVHRDISPQNVLISRDGTVKIVDFGIAKAANMVEDSPNLVKGKFCYMSPEQASARGVDQRSDLFSLGVVLFELLCRRSLFKQDTQEQTLSLVKSAVVPDLKSLNPEVSDVLEAIVYKALARDVESRHQSARELQQELARALMGLGQLHDAYTLADHLAQLEPWLSTRGDARVRTNPSTQTDMLRTSLVRTSRSGGAGSHTTQERGQTLAPTEPTPITPALMSHGQSPSSPVQTRERKEVVIIAGNLQGLLALRARLGQERWLQVFQEYTRMVDALAFKNDGVVHRVNEAGFVLLLGLPVSSENDAERAARVALDLQDALGGINLSLDAPLRLTLGLGVADVLLEQTHGEQGRRYTWSFFGDSHEFAQWLATSGLGKEILLGGQVYRRIRQSYATERIDALKLPSVQGKAQAYRLLGPKSGRERLKELRHAYHALYGRELELKTLRASYRQSLIDATGAAYVLYGEQGVGKSTLVEAFLRGLDPRDVRVVRGVVSPFDQDVPLGGMSALLAELLRLGSPDDLRQVRATLETRVQALCVDEPPEELELLVHSIGGVFGLRYPGSIFDELSGEDRRRRISMSLRKLLRRFAQKKPFVIAIEDAQYVDQMTLEITTQLFDARQDSPIFIIMTLTCAQAPPDRWKALLGARHVRAEHLGQLSAKEAHAMARALLRAQRVEDDELAQELVRHTGGNPFYVREVVDALRDRGLLQDSAERRQLRLLGDEGGELLPASVEGLIQARVDRLPLRLKSSLQRIALLWSTFRADEVRALLDPQDADALGELVALGFLERVTPHQVSVNETFDPEAQALEQRAYRFCNAMTQEVVARTIVDEAAQQVHARIAAHLESRMQRDGLSVTELAVLARHLDGAGMMERAIDLYMRAASQAFEQFGAAECLRLCEHVCSRAAPDSPQAYEALHLRAKALRLLGHLADYQLELERLGQCVQARDVPEERAQWLLLMSRHHYDQADFKQAMAHLERLRAFAQDDPALSVKLAQSWHHEALIRLDQGARQEALALVDRAIEVYERAPQAPRAQELLACYNTRGIILRRSGRHVEAIDTYERLRARLDVASPDPLARYVQINLGLALVYVGRYSDGLELYERVLTQTRRLGLRREEAAVLINLGHAYQVLGELEQAQAHLQRGLVLARKAAAHYVLADGEISLGVVYAERGDVASAERLLHEGLRLAESIPHVYLAVHAMLALARLRLDQGGQDQARLAWMQAEDCLERSQQAHMAWGEVASWMIMARALDALAERERALSFARRALEADVGYAYEETRWLYYTLSAPAEPGASAHPSLQVERLSALAQAAASLRHKRDAIRQVTLRDSFMARKLHREIMTEAAARGC